MFLRKRKVGKKVKYYLMHKYREGKQVKTIERYLGTDLKPKQLEKLKARAENIIKAHIKELSAYYHELSKQEIEQYQHLEKSIQIKHLAKINWEKFTQSFTYHTNAIEGSTVENSEVKQLLNKNIPPEDADDLETINVANTIQYIRTAKEKLTLTFINKIHHMCFKNTKSFAGKFRTGEVVIRDGLGNIHHRGAPQKIVTKLLKELITWYNKHKNIYPPLLLASVVHNQFEHIHPYADGNGRVGRILLNYILLQNKYPPINIRQQDRMRYYKTLQTYHKTGDVKTTIKFLLNQYKKMGHYKNTKK
tara:strand:+ start:3173 stop:4087 length:915 start_codon:yes stop_codon:yes gene_type:complete